MEDLDKKWIWNEGDSCNVSDQEFSKRLGLKNLEGIFILVAGGVLSGIPLIVMELIYFRCRRRYEAARSDGSTQQQRSSNSQVSEVDREGRGCCDSEVMFRLRVMKETTG